MNYTEELANELNDVLKRSYDAIEGYSEAIDDLDHKQLAGFFRSQIAERKNFARELSSEIISLGGEPATEGSFKASLHRAWMDLKSSVASNSTEKTLEECIRGEKAARDDYDGILKGDLSLTPRVINMLTRHKAYIEDAISTLESMESAASV